MTREETSIPGSRELEEDLDNTGDQMWKYNLAFL